MFVRSSGAGYQLGIVGASGTVTYGATVLPFGSDQKVVIGWNFIAGTLNDTFDVYVNPTDPIQANNTAYIAAGSLGICYC